MKTALISVFDKKGVVELVTFLKAKDWRIVSTGGTFTHLKEAGLNPIEVASVTQAAEMLDGRVKTLHPVIHGGILARRDIPEHMQTLKTREIDTIDMVVVNLYPFFEKMNDNLSFDETVEFIDIGGPSMIRSAAKNHKDVTVLSDVNDYQQVMDEMTHGDLSIETRQYLAAKAFNLTAAYDGAIAKFFCNDLDKLPYFTNPWVKESSLRYGENSHQKSWFYKDATHKGAPFTQLWGKELSFNNIRDMDTAWKVVREFEEPAVCGLKHSTPCGVALGESIDRAYLAAYEGDPMSIFGGIVAANKRVNRAMAEECIKIFLEIVIAPSFDDDALEILKTKKNLRVIQGDALLTSTYETIPVQGGILVQECDNSFTTEFKVVTKKQPTPEEMKDLIFAQKVVKHVKSNAIVAVHGERTLGVGTGQPNRYWATEHALDHGKGKATVIGSDAFFPFKDVVELCAERGVKAIIQPGGSIRDQESIDACDELGIAMVVTGMRHFKH